MLERVDKATCLPGENTEKYDIQRVSCCNYQDTIQHSGEEQSYFEKLSEMVSSAFSYVWENLKSLFRAVFFCESCNYSTSTEDTTQIQQFIETLETLKKDFLETKKLGKSELKEWWLEKFNKLDPGLQRLIVMEDLTWAGMNKCSGNRESGEGWAQEAYKDDTQRETSLWYVRDLEILEDSKGKFDPTDDNQLPAMLGDIIANLKSRVVPQSN